MTRPPASEEVAIRVSFNGDTLVLTPRIDIEAYEWIDGSELPTRAWVYGHFLARRTVSVTIAAGGTGKSSLAIVDALAMAAGRKLLHDAPPHPLRVAVWNLEDELTELHRRIAAACRLHNVSPEEIDGRLFVNGADKPFIIAAQDRIGAKISEESLSGIIAAIRRLRLDVLILDPFVSSHAVQENDNLAIDQVTKAWARVAREANCAIHIIHHARKTNGGPADIESARGASSLIAAARAARVMNLMTKDEAQNMGVTENRLQHVRIDNGKSNFAALADTDLWLKIESVPLMNGPDPDPEGDLIGVMTVWQPPRTFEGVTAADLLKAQEAVNEGGPWRENKQSPRWVGVPIAQALGLDPFNEAARARIAAMLKIWIKNGAFVTVQGTDEKRNPRTFVEVGKWAR